MTEEFHSPAEKLDIYESLIENTGTHLAYLDADFKFVTVNSAYANGSGHAKTELMGRNHFDLFPNEANRRIFEKVRDSGQSIEYKARPFEDRDQPWRGVTYWDWTLRPVKDETGRVQGMVLSLTDVTDQERTRRSLEESIYERKRIEAALRESEARYRALFENSIDAIFLTAPDGSVFAANQAACAMFGMTEPEIIDAGRDGLCNLADPRYRPSLAERADSMRIRCDLSFIRKDGTIFEAEVSTVILNDRIRSFVILRDIPERMQTLQNL